MKIRDVHFYGPLCLLPWPGLWWLPVSGQLGADSCWICPFDIPAIVVALIPDPLLYLSTLESDPGMADLVQIDS